MPDTANPASKTNSTPIQAELVQNIPVKQPDTPGDVTLPAPAPAQPPAEPVQPAAKAKPAPAVLKPPKPASDIPHAAIFIAIVASAILVAVAYYAFNPS